jgi:hypothetical protein
MDLGVLMMRRIDRVGSFPIYLFNDSFASDQFSRFPGDLVRGTGDVLDQEGRARILLVRRWNRGEVGYMHKDRGSGVH